MLNVDRHIAIWAGWIAGPAFGVAMMAAPDYLKLEPPFSGLIFWGGIVVFLLTIFVLLMLRFHEERKRKIVLGPILVMAFGAVIFCGGTAWYFWPTAHVKHAQTSEITVHESERRSALLSRLRQEYILSHDGISPALLAGIENPPSDWVNERLRQLGESWQIAIEHQKPTAQKPELRLSMSGGNVFVPDAPDMRGLTGIALTVQVWNTGGGSVAIDWSLSVTPKGKPPIKAQLTKIPEQLVATGKPGPAVIRSADSLVAKTEANPIGTTPVAGTLLFYVRLERQTVLNAATELRLSVKDIYGVETAITQLMGNWLQR